MYDVRMLNECVCKWSKAHKAEITSLGVNANNDNDDNMHVNDDNDIEVNKYHQEKHEQRNYSKKSNKWKKLRRKSSSLSSVKASDSRTTEFRKRGFFDMITEENEELSMPKRKRQRTLLPSATDPS